MVPPGAVKPTRLSIHCRGPMSQSSLVTAHEDAGTGVLVISGEGEEGTGLSVVWEEGTGCPWRIWSQKN